MITIQESIQKYQDQLIILSKEIWKASEIRFETKTSADLMQSFLEKEGFQVERSLADMEHAFVAKYGQGKVKVGLLAEYDALEGMSQKALLYHQEKDPDRKHGHACGHNLLGVGSLAAAMALRDYIDKNPNMMSLYLYGTPAEESGYGKAFMAREGLFQDLDFVLAWHPYDLPALWADRTLAIYQIYFRFKGIASHASSSPELGRSALDAAELMNIGVNFLREHMEDQARIHYAFIDAGGQSANVVHPEATLYYFIRHESIEKVDALYQRVLKIAEGASLMTETEVEVIWDAACYDLLPNEHLSKVLYQNMERYLGEFTEKDYEHAEKYPREDENHLFSRLKAFYPSYSKENLIELSQSSINTEIADFSVGKPGYASTDVGDVSWNAPTSQIYIPCHPLGTAMHSWQWVSNGVSDFAHRGMFKAASILAKTAIDVAEDTDLLQAIQKEFKEKTKDKAYRPVIPEDVKPRQGL